MKLFVFINILFLIITACDKGISPPGDVANITGVQGSIFFQNWPPADSLQDLRLVAFKNFPPQNIVVEILNQQAFALPPISVDTTWFPFYVDRIDFEFELPPTTYGYLAVAQKFGPNILTDWRAVGHFGASTDSLPSPIKVKEGELVRNILISVDFKNLPIQPF